MDQTRFDMNRQPIKPKENGTSQPPPPAAKERVTVDFRSKAKLSSLPLQSFSVDVRTLGQVVSDRFNGDEGTRGVIITRNGDAIGILSRRRFFEYLGQQYGVEVFNQRPIGIMLEQLPHIPLILPASLLVSRAVPVALSRPADQAYEPIGIKMPTGEFYLAEVQDLLMAHNKEFARLERKLQTANKQLEVRYAEAEDARAEAEKANEIKTRFLANMSHELRTPLNAIINMTGFVTDGMFGEIDEQIYEALSKVSDSGEHLLSIINDVLDLTKVEAGLMSMYAEEVDVNAALSSIVSTTKGLIKNKPIRLEVDIDEYLPPVWGDKRRVRQMFLNLVSNAAKYTREGTIRIECHLEANEIHFSVRDTGIGIDPNDFDTIFESFRQARNNQGSVISTGLGLPLAKEFVEVHRGRLWFESEVGRGSTFHIKLPVMTPDPETLKFSPTFAFPNRSRPEHS